MVPFTAWGELGWFLSESKNLFVGLDTWGMGLGLGKTEVLRIGADAHYYIIF